MFSGVESGVGAGGAGGRFEENETFCWSDELDWVIAGADSSAGCGRGSKVRIVVFKDDRADGMLEDDEVDGIKSSAAEEETMGCACNGGGIDCTPKTDDS